MFQDKEYGKAKPAFAKFVKSNPNNASYNYWYGVCCFETGETLESLKYLDFARKKKIQSAPLYLGLAYDKLYRFDDAVEAYEEYLEGIEGKKISPERAEALLSKSKVSARLLKGVENVCFIDSFVVGKKEFLAAYKISGEVGAIYTYNKYFEKEGENPGTVYETELGNKIYYGALGEDSTLNIYSRNKQLNEWSKESKLPGSINESANANYPFVLTDGITLYYASDGETSMGGYDIFVTRYNTDNDTYLSPENVGMPFNSPFNDYMYAIDEYNNLGWFASDRYQPEDTVCVYVFIPNAVKQAYNYESMEPEKITGLAQLRSIKETWKDEAVVAQAKKRLEEAVNYRPEEKQEYDFTFVINDNRVYHSAADFTSSSAGELFREYQQLEKEYLARKENLERQREAYANAGDADKTEMAPAILDLEKRVLMMYKEAENLRIKIRNVENDHLKQ